MVVIVSQIGFKSVFQSVNKNGVLFQHTEIFRETSVEEKTPPSNCEAMTYHHHILSFLNLSYVSWAVNS